MSFFITVDEKGIIERLSWDTLFSFIDERIEKVTPVTIKVHENQEEIGKINNQTMQIFRIMDGILQRVSRLEEWKGRCDDVPPSTLLLSARRDERGRVAKMVERLEISEAFTSGARHDIAEAIREMKD